MSTIKPQRELSKQAIKRLESMTDEEKVRLLALLEIKECNNQINGILSVRPFVFYPDLRSELVHHLFDENDQYARERLPETRIDYFENERKTINYKMLVNLFMQKQDIYPKMDAYTATAFALYYNYFVGYASDIRTVDEFRQAKIDAYHDVKPMADLFNLNLNYVEEDNKKTASLLAPDYRVALDTYLRKDLHLGNKREARVEFLKEYFIHDLDAIYGNEDMEEHGYDVYANNVQEYYDEKGNVYYLDADGNVYYPDQVGDYHFEGGKMQATENGITEEHTKE